MAVRVYRSVFGTGALYLRRARPSPVGAIDPGTATVMEMHSGKHRADRLRRYSAALAPGASLVLLYLLYMAIKRITRVEEGSASSFVLTEFNADTVEKQSADLLARLNLGVSAVVYVVAWAACVFVMFHTICRVNMKRTEARFHAPIAGLVMLGIGILLGIGNPLTITPLRDLLVHSLDWMLLAHGQQWLELANAMGISVALLFVGAAAVTLSAPVLESTSPAAGVADIALRIRMIDRSLYAGAVVLVAAVLHASILHGLPRLYLPQADEKSLNDLASGITFAQGTLWTLTLLAIYVPTAGLLRK